MNLQQRQLWASLGDSLSWVRLVLGDDNQWKPEASSAVRLRSLVWPVASSSTGMGFDGMPVKAVVLVVGHESDRLHKHSGGIRQQKRFSETTAKLFQDVFEESQDSMGSPTPVRWTMQDDVRKQFLLGTCVPSSL